MIGTGRMVWRLMCLASAAIFASSPSLPAYSTIIDEQIANVAPPSALNEMSTGPEQKLLYFDDAARSRNAAIPVSVGQLRNISAFTAIPITSSQYPLALECLTQAIYYEAGNEPMRGKQAVAQVVLNRVRHSAYPNTICGVVYEGASERVCQFSFTCDGALLREPLRRQWQASAGVARLALSGEQSDVIGTATHYHADYVVPRWAYTLTKLEVIGAHIFYRFPGRNGEPRAFGATWGGTETVPSVDWSRFDGGEGVMAEDRASNADAWVSGLTVAPSQTDRHTENDVGGRLDTTKQWRLSIPDPVASQSSLDNVVDAQSAHDDSL